jgi:hypothetical protein
MNPELFSQIPGEKSRKRLQPEYIESNRIYEYVKVRQDLSINGANIADLAFTEGKFDELKRNLPNIDDNVLKYYLSEIESIMELEEKTKRFGTFLHEAIAMKSSDRTSAGYTAKVKGFVASPDNVEIFGIGKDKEWYSKIDSIVNEVLSRVRRDGNEIISEVALDSDSGALAQIRGKLDLIAIDKDGKPQIYEIKISKSKYSDWDKVKLATTD